MRIGGDTHPQHAATDSHSHSHSNSNHADGGSGASGRSSAVDDFVLADDATDNVSRAFDLLDRQLQQGIRLLCFERKCNLFLIGDRLSKPLASVMRLRPTQDIEQAAGRSLQTWRQMQGRAEAAAKKVGNFSCCQIIPQLSVCLSGFS